METLTDSERSALLKLCAMAAYADGEKNDLERAEVKRIFEGIEAPQTNPLALYSDALRQPQPIAETAAQLQSPAARALAYEMAVCICDADKALNSRERDFLERLRSALGLDAHVAATFEKEADAIATASSPLVTTAVDEVAVPPVLPNTTAPPTIASASADKMILNYAILNGALELLPQSVATMAIIPLQMKMVYRIGKLHGVELDKGHIREFLAAAGIGITSQVVEGYARKLLGGVLGKALGGSMGKWGKMGKSIANQAAGSAFSFASTYALGQLANRYYSGGRTLSGMQLRDMFGSLLGEAQSLHSRYADDIQAQVSKVNLTNLLPMIRGGR